MKATRFLLQCGAPAVLTACLLSASISQAQTFTGQKMLSASPVQLEASVYPLTNVPSTIKVSFNNRMGGSVRVVIRNEKGKVFYDEFESTAFYRRKFDLSPLPEGNYTVELSKRGQYYAQAFVIDEPEPKSHIAMGTAPTKIAPDNKLADKKLIVSQ